MGIEVASVLDFGAVYAGVVSQRQLEISNTGIGVLNISGISVSSGLSVEPSSLGIVAGSSQSVAVSLVAPASFNTGNLILSSNDTDESSLTVEVRAQVEALTAGGDDQLLTITGEVSGQLNGNTQVYVSLGSFSSQDTLTAAGGSYRFTILDLSDASAIPSYSAGDELTIRVKDLDSDTVLDQLSRALTVSEISAGLVRENFAIQLMPEIEVASVLDFGAVYAGVVSQRQLEISNTGIGVLTISGISVSSGLSVEPSSLSAVAGSSQSVMVGLVASATFSTGNLILA